MPIHINSTLIIINQYTVPVIYTYTYTCNAVNLLLKIMQNHNTKRVKILVVEKYDSFSNCFIHQLFKGGILKEPTTPCRCEEKSTQADPENEVETSAFLSLLTPTIEIETSVEKPERHADIPTASPADKYRLSNYILKREGISSALDTEDRITSRALPFNNPHPVDFDATPKMTFNTEYGSRQNSDAIGKFFAPFSTHLPTSFSTHLMAAAVFICIPDAGYKRFRMAGLRNHHTR